MLCKRIPIWEGQPEAYRPGHGVPVLSAYVPEGKEKRPSILILPGSAYIRCFEGEAEAVALKCTSQGLNAFVLYYSVRPNTYPQPFYDGFRAIQMLRENADAWLVEEDRIAVLGFSAGGHLAAGLGVLGSDEAFFSGIPILDRRRCRPNALLLGYALITAGEYGARDCLETLLGEKDSPRLEEVSFEKRIPPDMPPVFLWHALGDTRVLPENSLLLATALREKRIPFELHLYDGGFHGMAACDDPAYGKKDKRIGSWLPMALEWLDAVFEEKQAQA